MDFCGGILANKPPHYSKICMGEERELNKTHSSGDSHYLYGKIIQVTCPSHYGRDLVKMGLVIARFYCTIVPEPWTGGIATGVGQKGHFSCPSKRSMECAGFLLILDNQSFPLFPAVSSSSSSCSCSSFLCVHIIVSFCTTVALGHVRPSASSH